MAEVSLKVAQANMEHLVRLASTGNNGSDVHFGILTTGDGKQHIVKFDAGKKSLTPEMRKSIEDLKTAVRSWKDALQKAVSEGPKEGGDVAKLRMINVVGKLAAHIASSDTLSAGDLKNAIRIAVASGMKMPDLGARSILKPFTFKETREALDGSVTFEPTQLSNRVSENVGKRSKLANFFNAIGRKIMTATHAVKSFFTGKVTKSAGWYDTVETFAAAGGEREPFIKLPKARDPAKPYAFDPATVAASCGLEGRVTLSTMPDLNLDTLEKCIYPSGSPNIRDIKQDPSVQDCWFLASVASLLHSQGPKAIERLITVSQDQTTATVRLGRDHYTVPLCDVMVGGCRAASHSAPWVRILEQAMAMHLATKADDGFIKMEKAKMAFGSGKVAIQALIGRAPNDSFQLEPFPVHENTIDALYGAMYDEEGKLKATIVMGNGGGVTGTMASLGSGVSPDHLVSVLSVDRKNRRVTILDPYGHPRHLSERELSNFSILGLAKDDVALLQSDHEKFDAVPARTKAEQKAEEEEKMRAWLAERRPDIPPVQGSNQHPPRVWEDAEVFDDIQPGNDDEDDF